MDSLKKKLNIKPISPTNKADQAEERIRDYLRRMDFKPGDLLPKEQKLADALGVSRNVVREALSRLRMLGMIKSKKKRGMILASPDLLSGFERVLDPSILSEDSLKDLFELRLLLEMGLADLLFIRKTEEDIAELEAIVDRDQYNGDHRFKLTQEINFHGKLYQIAGNSTLMRFQKLLLPIFQFVLRKEEAKDPEMVQVGSKSHKDLVEVLKSGTPSQFRETMRAHLEPHFDWLKEKTES